VRRTPQTLVSLDAIHGPRVVAAAQAVSEALGAR
jgi:hypothetical protein